MSRVYNFAAGPAVLPEEVLKEAADEMLDYNGTGMSVMEMSHRSKDFEVIIQDAERNLRELMNIPNNFKWSELSEEELNNLPLEEKQQFLKENEANIRECIGEAVPTIIMQKIAKNIKEVLITGKKSQKKGQTRLI